MTSPDRAGFCHQFRVYYADTDAGGVAYHARYLDFAERARTEMLRQIGHPLVSPAGEQFMVRSAQIDWRAPARLDELLTCQTTVDDIRGARLALTQTILRDPDQVLAVIALELVHVSAVLRPVRLPASLIGALTQG